MMATNTMKLASGLRLHSRGALRLCSTASNSAVSDNRKPNILASYKRGRGGRSSFNGVVATVFGASGFLGRYVVSQLSKIGTQVVVAYRGPVYDVEFHKMAGDLGQILYSFYNLKDDDSIRKAMQHSNVVVNLIGRDWETKNFTYNDVHVDGCARIARIAAQMGVEKLVHVSAMNASPDPEITAFGKPSQYLKTKGLGELAVREHYPDAVIIRPSDMWGDEDRFFHYWCDHWRQHFGTLPLWKGGELTMKQPVDVVNVAQGIARAVTEKGTEGNTFEFVGPRSYYLSDMLDFFYDEIRVGPRPKIPINFPSFLLKVMLCETVYPATAPLVKDRLMREAVSDRLTGCPTLEDLGVKLNLMETAARYQLKIHKRDAYYLESLNEIASAAPPPTVEEVESARKVHY